MGACEQQGGASVTEVVEADVRKSCLLQEASKALWRRLEGLIARARGEEQPLVFVAVPQYLYLAQPDVPDAPRELRWLAASGGWTGGYGTVRLLALVL